ncbi:hypothetical protein EDD29_7890 [Actinocorallia herbida]|uniref:Uncharacterized protein n=1 Tax=Actinocorallia herbida TaxID=58109 RepID=A0A3N1D9F9_9ACTN|nr:hypothetical protein EDD29_7890 [Actinocorallia herbida]
MSPGGGKLRVGREAHELDRSRRARDRSVGHACLALAFPRNETVPFLCTTTCFTTIPLWIRRSPVDAERPVDCSVGAPALVPP